MKEEKSMEDSLTGLYNISWGQCSDIVHNRYESLINYESMNASFDEVELLMEIRNISNELQISANVYDPLDESKRKYYTNPTE